jgi:hypothetical protein
VAAASEANERVLGSDRVGCVRPASSAQGVTATRNDVKKGIGDLYMLRFEAAPTCSQYLGLLVNSRPAILFIRANQKGRGPRIRDAAP